MIRPRALLAFGPAALLACSSPASDDRFAPTLPDRTSFPPVAQMLVQRCGTLDCHGSRSRNLRLFGNVGLRWSSSDRPLTPLCTTNEEIAQDYESVVLLEPERMSEVVAEGGTDPERLTLVRKARGSENHKGGALMQQGDAADVCLTSWLASHTRTDVCVASVPPTPCTSQP